MPRGLHLSSYGARSKVSESANAARASVYNANVGIMSASEPAGVALERRPSRLLSLPRSGVAMCLRCLRDERDGDERGRSGERGDAATSDGRGGAGRARRRRRPTRASERVPGARAEARGGCGVLTGGDATEASRVNHSRAGRATTERPRAVFAGPDFIHQESALRNPGSL